ncbi:DUF4393 domain-containing protein [Nocardia panacis]|uniref:DUF4393 domain-containing protein n=1 Tax=Nocardia panacis TaxID=2340916 RepID=A0A3A4KLB9_9NOCA|nr:Abi-alpha family protein [Nocardia panacis]RJO76348.1 DUF4393 domain-containing protein [Nocardia panacis]
MVVGESAGGGGESADRGGESAERGGDLEAADRARASSRELVRQPDPTAPSGSGGPLRTVRGATGVARVAWSAASGVTAWGIDTALGVAGTVVKSSMAGTPPREVFAEAQAEVREAVRRALGIAAPAADSDATAVPTLREQGAALLRKSANPHGEQLDSHPAFASMLSELTPDEARILRFLRLDGAQPAIDIRLGRPRALGAERIVAGLNLIGEHAGLRFPNRIQQYLTNLRRLGLIEFHRDPVDDPHRYQVLEAQSPVREVLKRSGFGTKVYYRSIALTGFGGDFVQTCLPVVQDGRASGTQ